MTDVSCDVTVVIPCHTERRWAGLCRAVSSVLTQAPPPKTVIVPVDGNPALYERLRCWNDEIEVVLNTSRPGASATRNAGAALAQTSIVAFLDDDASAHPHWLTNLTAPFETPEVVGTGGFVAPHWRVPTPRWFPPEFAWVVGASFRGLPTTRSVIRNAWSENMAVRRAVFEKVGGFRVDFGKVGDVSRPEDTDLCIRMSTETGGRWIFVPEAVVDHDVEAERARFSFFLRRCYLEGRGKIELARLNGGRADLVEERLYMRRTLPHGIVEHALRGLRARNLGEVARAGAIVAGITSAGCGATVAAARGLRK